MRKLFNWMMRYAGHPHATWVLVAVAFAESSFFPIPPDPLYIAMILGDKKQAWKLAFICTLSSVIGGILGYYIGYALFEILGEWIVNTYGMQESLTKIQMDFQKWGFWIVALKGLTPIPYKIVTIASGLAKLSMPTFIVASVIARGFRFFSLAAVLWKWGPEFREYLDKNLNLVVYTGIAALVFGFIVLKYIW